MSFTLLYHYFKHLIMNDEARCNNSWPSMLSISPTRSVPKYRDKVGSSTRLQPHPLRSKSRALKSAARLEAQEAVVDKDAVQALADHFVHQRCRDRTVHAAAQRADHVLVRRHLLIRACSNVIGIERACSDLKP